MAKSTKILTVFALVVFLISSAIFTLFFFFSDSSGQAPNIAGAIIVFGFAWIALHSGLILLAILGFYLWRRHSKSGESTSFLKKLPGPEAVWIVVFVMLVLFVLRLFGSGLFWVVEFLFNDGPLGY